MAIEATGAAVAAHAAIMEVQSVRPVPAGVRFVFLDGEDVTVPTSDYNAALVGTEIRNPNGIKRVLGAVL